MLIHIARLAPYLAGQQLQPVGTHICCQQSPLCRMFMGHTCDLEAHVAPAAAVSDSSALGFPKTRLVYDRSLGDHWCMGNIWLSFGIVISGSSDESGCEHIYFIDHALQQLLMEYCLKCSMIWGNTGWSLPCLIHFDRRHCLSCLVLLHGDLPLGPEEWAHFPIAVSLMPNHLDGCGCTLKQAAGL